MKKNVLVIGHAFIIKANRDVWSSMSKYENTFVDLVVPKYWKSNLVGEISYNPIDDEQSSTFKIFPIKVYNRGKGSTYFYHLSSLFQILKVKKYDEIIINQEGWSLSLLFFNLVNFFTINNKTRIFLMIAQNIFKPELKWSWPLEKFNFRFVDYALGCCNETKDVLRQKGILTPWMYFPLFYNEKLWRDDFESERNQKKIRFGYIGRISSDKGIESLLDAFDKFSSEEQVELHVAGDGPLSEKIKQNATKYYGVLAHDKVLDFYKEVDVIIIPSLTTRAWKEQFGRVIVEAVAVGKMVIGSNSGAIPDVMGELGLDYIFKENNSESLFIEMKRAQQDLGSDSYMSKLLGAREKCVEKFSEKAFIQRFLSYAS